MTKLLKLQCPVKKFDWGKKGNSSLVAKLCRGTIEPETPYAELWVGAHQSSPATVETTSGSKRLDDILLESGVEILGAKSHKQFGNELPFLFKVLSIGTALSIQAHPHKSLAVDLHRKDPKNYPDSNHKPEIAIALTDVELLYGFRPLSEIYDFLKNYPEFAALVSPSVLQEASDKNNSQSAAKIISRAYRSVLSAQATAISSACKKLWDRLRIKSDLSNEESWILKLAERFPAGDRGIFSFFFLNYLTLVPGEAIFTEPNIPHAYLYGDLVECMANSDNVVRAGLTNKFVDIETLSSMVNYEFSPTKILHPKYFSEGIQTYQSTCEEFCIDVINSAENANLSLHDSLQIIFCISGSGTINTDSNQILIESGDAYLIPATVKDCTLHIPKGVVYRARVP